MVKNPVLNASMQIEIEVNQNGNSYMILQTQANNIQSLSQTEYSLLTSMYAEGNTKFELENMQKMYFSPYSELSWSISPPSLQKFIEDFDSSSATIMQQTSFFDVKT